MMMPPLYGEDIDEARGEDDYGVPGEVSFRG